MPTLADVVRIHGPAYLAEFGASMLPSHRKALWDIVHCRTPEMGTITYSCDNCGAIHHAYCSCRNRACPQCHDRQTQQWLDKRRLELLPATYFHIVFTLPPQIHPLVRSNQKQLYPILMDSAAQALTSLAADKRHLAGKPAIMAVLHTSGQTLNYHPHVHCLVPAGAVCGGHWIFPRNKGFLLPVAPLSKLYRGIFLDRLRQAMPEVQVPRLALRYKWVVYCKEALQGSDALLSYLGRYVQRTAITNSRIRAVNEKNVMFTWRDRAHDNRQRTMTLSGNEFLRRFLQHVLPKGLHKVRYYGLWAPANKKLLHRIQALFFFVLFFPPPLHDAPHAQPQQPMICPTCKKGRLISMGPPQKPNHCFPLSASRGPP